MAVQLIDLLRAQLPALRYAPTPKRVRGRIEDRTMVDSAAAVLVWEPRYVTPRYAVPESDIDGELVPSSSSLSGEQAAAYVRRPVLDPSVPFDLHTTEGEFLEVRVRGSVRTVRAFRPADPDLEGRVLLDFRGMDEWREEDQVVVAHPRDPLHRIEVVPASRRVRVMLGDQVLADTRRASILLETMLPVRYYLPAEDIGVRLTPTETVTWCAYKGRASYLTAHTEEGPQIDVAWTYAEPRHDASEVRGLVAFFQEHVDLEIDGERLERPVTPWSRDGPPEGR
ncbi:DUF427 domain-containing protein [Naasia aerilata]|uniref:DUF427 domain-containing protein n=1 Tax=Naasia aerilata TaxID=1162966 RepID=A0ABN6XQE7_9MICO|nr:DUF427 domain-containing protein [Naasia aerilata]BDZ47212.1 hypothetical protein GCM10025866_31210 [Naasia aerilata]